MYCYYCGKKIPDEVRFCPYCGRQVTEKRVSEIKPEIKLVKAESDEMKAEKLLFESIGMPEKKKNMMNICGIILAACGGLMILLSMEMYGSMRQFGFVLGIVALIIGLAIIVINLCLAEKQNEPDGTRLAIYSGHVEGVDTNSHQPFSVRYEDIMEIGKTTFYANEILQIQTRMITYTVLTNELDKAYRIIDSKLNEAEQVPGNVNSMGNTMLRCRECGHEIGRSAEICPYCGAKTRYGSDVKKQNMASTSLCIELAVIVVGVILMIVDYFAVGFCLLGGGVFGLITTLRDAKR